MAKMYLDKVEEAYNKKILGKIDIVVELRKLGHDDIKLAKVCGVSLYEFRGALERFEVFRQAYEYAEKDLIANLRNIVYGRALGTDGKTNDNGQLLGADANLALRLLSKIDPAFRGDEQATAGINTIEAFIRKVNQKAKEEAIDVEVKDVEEEIEF